MSVNIEFLKLLCKADLFVSAVDLMWFRKKILNLWCIIHSMSWLGHANRLQSACDDIAFVYVYIYESMHEMLYIVILFSIYCSSHLNLDVVLYVSVAFDKEQTERLVSDLCKL